MKKGWQTKNLGDLCDVVGGGTPPKDKPAFYSGDIPWATVRDMRQDVITETEFRITKDAVKNSATNIIPSGNVVIATRVGLGKVCLLGQDTAINQDLRGIVPHSNKALVVRYLYWWLKSIADVIVSEGTGATVQGVKLPFVKSLQIPVPPLAEQQRIVGLLDEAFEGLATAKANAEKNLQNARALFESHLQSVFTQGSQSAAEGHGPGWVEKPFDEVCAITSTLVDPRKEEFLDLTHVGAGNIESKTGVFVDLKTAREEGLISGKFLFDESMVLYSKIRPYLMKVARPDFEGLCSADMYPLSPIKNVITRDYLFHLLLSKHFTDFAIQGSARAGMPKVNRDHLFAFKVYLPDVKKQKQLAANLDDLHEETQRLARLYERKHAALEALKKSLLHQAFTGALE
jgi:type I restriction enzyme, S subunit